MEYDYFTELLNRTNSHYARNLNEIEKRFLFNQFLNFISKCGLFISSTYSVVPMHGGLMGTIYHETRPNIEVKSRGHLAEGVVMTESDIINLISTFCNILEYNR